MAELRALALEEIRRVAGDELLLPRAPQQIGRAHV